MKLSCNRAFALAVISSAILFATASCKKSNNSNNSGPGIYATVNGTAWANSYPVIGVYFAGGNDFNIAGTQVKGGDTTGFTFVIYTPFKLNTPLSYSLSSQDIIAYLDAKTGLAYNDAYGNAHGQMTITSYDSTGHHIGGTFNGVLYDISGSGDSLVVTNGKFNTSYQVQ